MTKYPSSGDDLITEEMRAAIGRVVDWQVSFPIAESDIRRWAIAVYYPDAPPPRFRRSNGQLLVAPEEFNPFAWSVDQRMTPVISPGRRDTDRLEKALGLSGPGLRHQLNGGSEAEYGVPMRVGDVIHSETRLADYRVTAGRLGPMLITKTAVTWTNQDHELVRTGIDTSIRYGRNGSEH
ncbi:FAS1-like dehydratase domain-containing protein [Nocardia miyunensis]|uniref:FAS1-like dehydratase domain-containing protein n=1 Tax=Nocardia miyunensis TaxID=282684 RepID=UPI001FE0F9CB|nr:MaoC family dehydratase N-terminal domain-containing protein [Nocardia miyunensis]